MSSQPKVKVFGKKSASVVKTKVDIVDAVSGGVLEHKVVKPVKVIAQKAVKVAAVVLDEVEEEILAPARGTFGLLARIAESDNADAVWDDDEEEEDFEEKEEEEEEEEEDDEEEES